MLYFVRYSCSSSVQHPHYAHQLVCIVVPVKERLLAEDEASKHAAQTPKISGVIVHFVVHQQLWCLEVAGCHTNIVLSSRMIELSQPPVDQSKLALLVINHDIVGLHIAVHDTNGVAEIEGFKDLVNVVAHINVIERGIQHFEVRVVDVFEDERRCFRLWIAHHIQKLDHVDSTAQVLEDLDLALDFALFYRL